MSERHVLWFLQWMELKQSERGHLKASSLAKQCIHPWQAFTTPQLFHLVLTRADLQFLDCARHRVEADGILIALDLGVLPVEKLQLLEIIWRRDRDSSWALIFNSLAYSVVHNVSRTDRMCSVSYIGKLMRLFKTLETFAQICWLTRICYRDLRGEQHNVAYRDCSQII